MWEVLIVRHMRARDDGARIQCGQMLTVYLRHMGLCGSGSHHVQVDGRERQRECKGVEYDDDRQAPTDGVRGRQPSHLRREISAPRSPSATASPKRAVRRWKEIAWRAAEVNAGRVITCTT